MAATSVFAMARPGQLAIRQLGLGKARTPAFNEIRDATEVNVMRAWLLLVGAGAVYSASQQLVSSRAGSFFNVNTRGDMFRQMEVAEEAALREGRITPASDFTQAAAANSNKHTWWWRLAHM